MRSLILVFLGLVSLSFKVMAEDKTSNNKSLPSSVEIAAFNAHQSREAIDNNPVTWVSKQSCTARGAGWTEYTVNDYVGTAPLLAMIKCIKASRGSKACKCRVVACSPISVPFNAKKFYSWLVKKGKEKSIRKKLKNSCGY